MHVWQRLAVRVRLSGVSVRDPPESGARGTQAALPREGGPLELTKALNTARGRVRENVLSVRLSSWDISLVLQFRLGLRLGLTPSALRGLQLVKCSSWTFSASLSAWAQFLIKALFIYTSCWFCFSGEPRSYSCRASLGPSGLRQCLRFSLFFMIWTVLRRTG